MNVLVQTSIPGSGTWSMPTAAGTSSAPLKVEDHVTARRRKNRPESCCNSPFMDQLSIAVGIPTFEGGRALCVTLQTIYRQTCVEAVREVMVAVDGRRLAANV